MTEEILGSPTMRQFAEQFGEDNAQRVLSAAIEHNNGVHGEAGSDVFKWALSIAIGYECMKGRYAKYHGIKVDVAAVQAWCRENHILDDHDGDVDYLGLIVGAYEGWVTPSSQTNKLDKR